MSQAQFKYLIKVEPGENNNKFYKMQEDAGGSTFTASWARVGAPKPQSKQYPMNEWNSIYREKTKKGYVDNTELFAEVKVATADPVTGVVASDALVATLVIALQGYAKANTAKTYLVKAEAVTQAQIDRAQQHIDKLVSLFKVDKFDDKAFNAELIKLYTVIPRTMKETGEHLVYLNDGHFDAKSKKFVGDKPKDAKKLRDEIEKLINDEQSNLDTMASQVIKIVPVATDNKDPQPASKTLIESLGLKIKPVTDSRVLDEVRKLAQEHAKRVARVFEVENIATQKAFDAFVAKADDKKMERFWHGSRNQNWWWIIQQGLRIRPSSAVYTGSMFGDGCYFSNECDKSMGYTDNGRWVNGKAANVVIMSLFDVHIGKQYVTQYSDSSLSAEKLKKLGNYNSTWGQKGPSLRRHEYIIYNTDQSTIKYLVEFSV